MIINPDAIHPVATGTEQGQEPSSRNRNATAVMMLDIVTTVLKHPENIPETISQLSQKLRELTGARTVILSVIDALDDGQAGQRIMTVNPPCHTALSETGPVRELIETACMLDQATVLQPERKRDDSQSPPAVPDLRPCLIIPLKSGEERIGAILSLGLLDASYADSILEIQGTLSGMVSVVLKNALLVERQQRIRQALEREIEERRQAEVTLNESRQQFQGLVETLYDWVWEVDSQGRYTYVSPQITKILGYEPREILGKTPFDLMPPEEATQVSERANALFREQKPIIALENINIHKDGHRVVLETNGLPFSDADGNFKGYRGTDRDITRRKQTAELLAAERQRLAYILEGTNVGTWEWNVQTGQTVFNERWAELIGYRLEELAPVSIDTWTRFVHPDDLKTSGELLERHFNKELPYYECEARMRHRDGSWVWVLDRGKVVTWADDGKPLFVSGTHQDITARKLAEEKIRHMATHDGLTDLPSLSLAKDRLSMALGMARRHKNLTAVMFIDLDGFKAVNDTLGHDAGDDMLKQAAQRLLACIRETDTVARVGGDEFLIIATGLHSSDDAAQIAEKAIRLVSQPVTLNGKQAVVGASIGIALYPDQAEDIDQLIKQADQAMYRIKNTGKNGFCFANPAIG